MRVLHLAVVSAAAWLLAMPALADPPAQTDTSATTTTAQATTPPASTPAHPRRRHCEDSRSMGSVIPHRVCYTDEEWQARAEAVAEQKRRNNDNVCDRTGTMASC